MADHSGCQQVNHICRQSGEFRRRYKADKLQESDFLNFKQITRMIDATVPDVLVYTSPDGNSTSGTVSLALLRRLRKVTIDLKDMTLSVR